MRFPIAPKPIKIIAEKGTQNVYAHESSLKQKITVLLCICAAGYYVKPMVMYPSVNFKQEFINKFFEVLRDVEFGQSHNGWMDQELFLQWLQNIFEPTILTLSLRQPVLLVIDGVKVHLSIYASEFCDEHNVRFIDRKVLSSIYPVMNSSFFCV